MIQPLVIVGAGGFGREALCLVQDINRVSPTFDFLGFLADFEPNEPLIARLGANHLGPREAIRDLPRDVTFIVGIGKGAARREIGSQLSEWGYMAATLVHPTAFIGADIELAPGSVIAAGAAITTNVQCGAFLHVDRGAQVGHDSTLGHYVTINPSAVVSGGVVLGNEVSLGTNSTVLPGLRIAAGTIVGAGAVVVRDIETQSVVAGVPARPLGKSPL